MNRRQALSTLAAAALPTPLSAAPNSKSIPSSKKGWCGGDPKLHQLFNAKWYYTWSPKTRTNKNLEFIPMIKGTWSLKQIPDIETMPGIKHLLGFNEPERTSQGNVSIQDALKLWPQLVALAEKKNLRLGSPAPSSDNPGLKWLDTFMAQAKKNKLRIDFIAIHWYKSRNPSDFESFVKSLERNYRLPIWITEFNGWTGPEDENYKFLKASLKFLEKNKAIERYAYFNVKNGTPLSLLDKDGQPTRMGKLYQET